SLPLPTSHNRTVPSSPPLASSHPSGAKATLQTAVLWYSKRRNSLPLPTSHNRTVPTSSPLASRIPSGLKVTLFKDASGSGGRGTNSSLRGLKLPIHRPLIAAIPGSSSCAPHILASVKSADCVEAPLRSTSIKVTPSIVAAVRSAF